MQITVPIGKEGDIVFLRYLNKFMPFDVLMALYEYLGEDFYYVISILKGESIKSVSHKYVENGHKNSRVFQEYYNLYMSTDLPDSELALKVSETFGMKVEKVQKIIDEVKNMLSKKIKVNGIEFDHSLCKREEVFQEL